MLLQKLHFHFLYTKSLDLFLCMPFVCIREALIPALRAALSFFSEIVRHAPNVYEYVNITAVTLEALSFEILEYRAESWFGNIFQKTASHLDDFYQVGFA